MRDSVFAGLKDTSHDFDHESINSSGSVLSCKAATLGQYKVMYRIVSAVNKQFGTNWINNIVDIYKKQQRSQNGTLRNSSRDRMEVRRRVGVNDALLTA